MDLEYIFAALEPPEGSRTILLRDLWPSVHQVPFTFFQKNILPRFSNNIEPIEVLQRLKQRGEIENGRWTAFPSDPYTHSSRKSSEFTNDSDNDVMEEMNENRVFASLCKIVTAIQQCATTGTSTIPTTEYVSAPHSAPVCLFDEKAGRPDAYFVLPERPELQRRDGRIEWRNIVTPAEFKLRDNRESLLDDVKKICWNMYQVLVEDPRRRFVLGFTIENTAMRIWMGNRTEVVVAEPFNFITEHEKVIHFFLSQLFGCEAHLGIDTTMTVVEAAEGQIPVYDIEVQVPLPQGQNTSEPAFRVLIYRTIRLINDDGARALRGSATRVWEVVPVVNGVEQSTEVRVLKDSWVDDKRKSESEILRSICDEPTLNEVSKNVLASLFLTPVAAGDVYITDGHDGQQKLDSTRGLATRGAPIPADATRFSLTISANYKSSHDTQSVSAQTIGGAGAVNTSMSDGRLLEQHKDEAQSVMLVFGDKHHHRVVFQELCEPLSKEQSLHRVFRALASITSGLGVMHMSGWVHRDMSPSNILEVPRTEDVKLSDLEYAKRLDDESSHAIRTGTLNFMAVEVDQRSYLFNTPGDQDKPEAGSTKDTSIDDLAAYYQKIKESAQVETSASPSPVSQETTKQKFAYNPLHDLESIWWIAIYFVVNKETEPSTPAAEHTHLTEGQRMYARSLFYDAFARYKAIRNVSSSPLDDHLLSLPSHLSTIALELIRLRRILTRHYTTIEKPGFIIDNMVCRPIYSSFIDAFTRIYNSLSQHDVLVSPLPPDPHDQLFRKTEGRSQQTSRSRTSQSARAPKRRKVDAQVAPSGVDEEDSGGRIDVDIGASSSARRTTRSMAKGKTVVRRSSRKRK